jgi:hypothetical protein
MLVQHVVVFLFFLFFVNVVYHDRRRRPLPATA